MGSGSAACAMSCGGAREWFEQMNCALPDDETRSLPSPDVADAFVLTFAEVGRGRQKVRRTRQASWRVT